MSAVERRGAPEPRRPSRNPDFKPRLKRPLARPRRPVSTSTCLPDGSRSTHKRPIYVSFVNKAILWERGICHYTAHDRPDRRPTLCPRFLSHMNASPDNLRAPCFLSSRFRLQPPSQGNTHTPTAPQTHTLEGYFHLNPDIRRNVPTEDLITGRHSAVVVPCLPLPATPPPSSTFYQTPPQQNTLHTGSGGQLTKPNNVPTTPSDPHSNPTLLYPTEEKDEVKEGEPNPESDQKLLLGPSSEPEFTASSVYSVSQGSLSDFSRPSSSLFSRSTDLASGRSSFLSADFRDSDPEDGAHFSALQSRLAIESPFAPFPLVESNLRQSPTNTLTTRPLYKPVFGQTKPLTPSPTTGVLPQPDKPLSRCESTNTTENLQQNASVDPGTLAFPSATWSSCPSPQSSTPRSGSGPNLTPSASVTRLESQRWSVLPPISPVRGRGGSAASRYSELSCSQSDAFDELEAIAPRSASSPSLDRVSDSSAFPSPVKELSPGLAALTVGCDSGNLGSLSRVQLLLLDRMEMGHSGQELSPVEDWFDPHYDPASFSSGVLRPLTAGSISERCDSAGQNKSDHSEGGSGSPSSWIIDQSPSQDMFRSKSNHSSSTEEGGPTEEESNYPGSRAHSGASAGVERPGSVDFITEENDRTMEERKTQVLNMLSKLQDNTPRQPHTHKGCSNFEEFDFLAKYCIFSQEKLVEYKRAFEAEDSDGDGYISCLQVLLALKDIIPPELLSEEEEIYVYRILEMVDFRVTDGLVDLRLFAVIASLAQKIATMDEFMRSLISDMDFRSLEVRLFKAKQLFLFLLEEQRGEPLAQGGFISAEQLLLELKAGGIHLEQEAAVRLELQHIPPLDLLDYLAYLPLFMLIHKSVISNPLDDSSNL